MYSASVTKCQIGNKYVNYEIASLVLYRICSLTRQIPATVNERFCILASVVRFYENKNGRAEFKFP